MSHSFDLYMPGHSWLHRMDPRAKLWSVLLAGVTGLIFKDLVVLSALVLLTQVALLAAQVSARHIRWLWVRLLPLLLLILILQPIFAPGPGPDLVALGPIRLTLDGILEGISFALRAAALTFVAAILLLTTEPTRLVQGLVKLGLPYPWGLTAGLAIRYLPTMYGLFGTISEAQQARGWIIGQGSFLRRVRSYVPILVATVIAALRLSDNLGLALAARGLGYQPQRTVLHDVTFAASDWLVVAVATLIFAGLLLLRYGFGFGAVPWSY